VTRSLRPRSSADLTAGLVFIGFGIAFGIGAMAYELGTLLRMGPGYFPLSCAAVLVGLGLLIVVKAYVSPDEIVETAERLQVRPILLLSAALTFFTVTIDGLGFAAATFGTAALAALARKGTTPQRVLIISVSLTVACYLIFVVALRQRLPVIGEWLTG
jgi:hypothetical protein